MTKEHIQSIAPRAKLPYHAPARNLSLRQSFTIAFFAPVYNPEFLTAEDLFGLELLGGIGNGLHNLGYDLLIVNITPGDTTWAHYYFDVGRVDGFIIKTSNRRQWHIKTLVEMGAPFIGWDIPVPQYTGQLGCLEPKFFVKDGKITGIIDFERAMWAEPLMEQAQ